MGANAGREKTTSKVDAEIFDFGFTAVTEEELQASKELNSQLDAASATAEEWTNRFYNLKEMVMVLLNNLSKNPEKEYILWPDRGLRIKAFIDKIDALDG